MAKVSAKGAVITVASTDVSAFVESYDIEWAQQMDEITGFGEGWKNFLPGIPVQSITLTIYWDKTASTGTFAKLKALMTTPGTVSIVPEATGPTLSGTFVCEGIHVTGQSNSGAIKMGSVKLSPSGSAVATFA